MQVITASAGGCPADLDTISEELIKQLSSGQTPIVTGLLSLQSIVGRRINNMDRAGVDDMKLASAGEHSKRRRLPC